MNNITIDDDDPTLPRVNVEDIDIDHIAINVLVAHERTGELLQSLLGNSVTLATKKGRSWHPENWNLMILVWNPFIILTVLSNVVKENLCCFFTDHGHVVLPSGEEAKHVIKGHPKPGLVHVGVEYIRLVNFGMKQRIQDLPPFPPELLQNNAVANGHPVNEYDVSATRKFPYLYLMKPVPPIPRDITVDQFPILSPINPHLARSLGGNINLVMEQELQVRSMKVYNITCSGHATLTHYLLLLQHGLNPLPVCSFQSC
jgi:hypothetical protein